LLFQLIKKKKKSLTAEFLVKNYITHDAVESKKKKQHSPK